MRKSDIVSAIQELIQDDSGTMQTLASRWVDLVLLDLSARGALPSLMREEMTTLFQGQRDYSLMDTDRIVKVFVPAWGTEGVLRKLNRDEFLHRMLEDGVAKEGRPRYYSIFADNILRLHPLPDAASAPAEPTNDEHLHVYHIPSITMLQPHEEIMEIKEKHIPLIFWGTYQYASRFRRPQEIEEALAMYNRGVRDLLMDIYNDPELQMESPRHDF